jgi:hypothetical protein
VSTKVPPPLQVKVASEQLGAVTETVDLLRSLGHEVVERDPEYGTAVIRVLARYLRGIHDAAQAMPHPERLARRTRGYVRLGGLVPPAAVARARAGEAADRERLNRVFDGGVDVLVTPTFTRAPLQIGEYEGRGTQWTLNGTAAWVPHLAHTTTRASPRPRCRPASRPRVFRSPCSSSAGPTMSPRSCRSPPRSRRPGPGRTGAHRTRREPDALVALAASIARKRARCCSSSPQARAAT